MSDDNLLFKDNLHPNWKQLYYIIHILKVKSVYECGCGCAHHLINIYKLLPELELNGCDYSQDQINIGYKMFDLSSYNFHKKL